MGGQQSSFLGSPPIEKVLADALKPHRLEETYKYIATLKQLKAKVEQDEHKIQPIIDFLHKISEYSSACGREKWFLTTYSRTMSQPLPNAKKEAASSYTMHKVVVDSLNDELERLRRDVETEKDKAKQLERSLSRECRPDEKERLQWKKDVEDLLNEKQKLRIESQDLRERLSKEMSDKIAKDEGSLENVSIKNRPMKVAEEYDIFCSNAWFAAKSILDDKEVPNQRSLRALSDILKTAEKHALEKQEDVTKGICSIFCQQADKGAMLKSHFITDIKMATKDLRKIPDGLKNAIGDFLRTTADTADISAIVEEIHKTSQPDRMKTMRESTRDLRGGEKLCRDMMSHLDDYMKECAKLTWKMAVQRPPMTFDNKLGIGKMWKGEKYSDVFYDSEDPLDPANVVQFYVFPVLKHKDAVMVKGKVFVSKLTDVRKDDF